VRGSNARNLSVLLSLSQASKNAVFLIISSVFSSTKLEKRAEQNLPGTEVGGGEREGVGAARKRWPKQCMHI
jgi:hypothetical protein